MFTAWETRSPKTSEFQKSTSGHTGLLTSSHYTSLSPKSGPTGFLSSSQYSSPLMDYENRNLFPYKRKYFESDDFESSRVTYCDHEGEHASSFHCGNRPRLLTFSGRPEGHVFHRRYGSSCLNSPQPENLLHLRMKAMTPQPTRNNYFCDSRSGTQTMQRPKRLYKQETIPGFENRSQTPNADFLSRTMSPENLSVGKHLYANPVEFINFCRIVKYILKMFYYSTNETSY